MFWYNVLRGVVSTMTVTHSELYRYPYRQAGEAFRGDWKRIGGDIEVIVDTLQEGEECDG